MSEKRKRYILPRRRNSTLLVQHSGGYGKQTLCLRCIREPKQPLKAEDLYPIFAKELCHQELNQTDAWIEIPEEVREMYKYYRSTPLVRAYGLEKALGTLRLISILRMKVSALSVHIS